MDYRHLIDDLSFETSLDVAVSSHPPGDDWPGFCRSRLLAVIDRVFEEFSPANGPVHRLDHLEVDMGDLADTLSAEEIEGHFESTLRQQLRDRFPGAVAISGMAPEAVARSVPRDVTALETLEYYLHNGLLPRSADTSHAYRLDAELIRYAGHEPEAVKALLLADHSALERTIRQLDDAALQRLLMTLSPGHSMTHQPGENVGLSAGGYLHDGKGGDTDARYSLWETIFLQALTGDGARPPPQPLTVDSATAGPVDLPTAVSGHTRQSDLAPTYPRGQPTGTPLPSLADASEALVQKQGIQSEPSAQSETDESAAGGVLSPVTGGSDSVAPPSRTSSGTHTDSDKTPIEPSVGAALTTSGQAAAGRTTDAATSHDFPALASGASGGDFVEETGRRTILQPSGIKADGYADGASQLSGSDAAAGSTLSSRVAAMGIDAAAEVTNRQEAAPQHASSVNTATPASIGQGVLPVGTDLSATPPTEQPSSSTPALPLENRETAISSGEASENYKEAGASQERGKMPNAQPVEHVSSVAGELVLRASSTGSSTQPLSSDVSATQIEQDTRPLAEAPEGISSPAANARPAERAAPGQPHRRDAFADIQLSSTSGSSHRAMSHSTPSGLVGDEGNSTQSLIVPSPLDLLSDTPSDPVEIAGLASGDSPSQDKGEMSGSVLAGSSDTASLPISVPAVDVGTPEPMNGKQRTVSVDHSMMQPDVAYGTASQEEGKARLPPSQRPVNTLDTGIDIGTAQGSHPTPHHETRSGELVGNEAAKTGEISVASDHSQVNQTAAVSTNLLYDASLPTGHDSVEEILSANEAGASELMHQQGTATTSEAVPHEAGSQAWVSETTSQDNPLSAGHRLPNSAEPSATNGHSAPWSGVSGPQAANPETLAESLGGSASPISPDSESTAAIPPEWKTAQASTPTTSAGEAKAAVRDRLVSGSAVDNGTSSMPPASASAEITRNGAAQPDRTDTAKAMIETVDQKGFVSGELWEGLPVPGEGTNGTTPGDEITFDGPLETHSPLIDEQMGAVSSQALVGGDTGDDDPSPLQQPSGSAEISSDGSTQPGHTTASKTVSETVEPKSAASGGQWGSLPASGEGGSGTTLGDVDSFVSPLETHGTFIDKVMGAGSSHALADGDTADDDPSPLPQLPGSAGPSHEMAPRLSHTTVSRAALETVVQKRSLNEAPQENLPAPGDGASSTMPGDALSFVSPLESDRITSTAEPGVARPSLNASMAAAGKDSLLPDPTSVPIETAGDESIVSSGATGAASAPQPSAHSSLGDVSDFTARRESGVTVETTAVSMGNAAASNHQEVASGEGVADKTAASQQSGSATADNPIGYSIPSDSANATEGISQKDGLAADATFAENRAPTPPPYEDHQRDGQPPEGGSTTTGSLHEKSEIAKADLHDALPVTNNDSGARDGVTPYVAAEHLPQSSASAQGTNSMPAAGRAAAKVPTQLSDSHEPLRERGAPLDDDSGIDDSERKVTTAAKSAPQAAHPTEDNGAAIRHGGVTVGSEEDLLQRGVSSQEVSAPPVSGMAVAETTDQPSEPYEAVQRSGASLGDASGSIDPGREVPTAAESVPQAAHPTEGIGAGNRHGGVTGETYEDLPLRTISSQGTNDTFVSGMTPEETASHPLRASEPQQQGVAASGNTPDNMHLERGTATASKGTTQAAEPDKAPDGGRPSRADAITNIDRPSVSGMTQDEDIASVTAAGNGESMSAGGADSTSVRGGDPHTVPLPHPTTAEQRNVPASSGAIADSGLSQEGGEEQQATDADSVLAARDSALGGIASTPDQSNGREPSELSAPQVGQPPSGVTEAIAQNALQESPDLPAPNLLTSERGGEASVTQHDVEHWRSQVMARVSGEFAAAIVRHAGKAADQARYYRRLLDALAGDDPIDPAAFAAQSAVADDVVVPYESITDETSASLPETSVTVPDRAWIEDLLTANSSALELVVVPLLAEAATAMRVIELWPEALLVRLFARLRPAEFDALWPYAEAMTEACVWDDTGLRRRRMWLFLAEVLFPLVRYGAAHEFVVAYADRLAAEAPVEGDFRATLCAALPDGAAGGRAAQYIRYWLQGARHTPGRAAQNTSPVVGQSGLIIGNAGQVLVSPYLPRLFDMLGMLDEGRFASPAQARRACHLLQFMVDERTDAPEHELVLNKLLCGLDLRQPLESGITINDREKSAIEGMLAAVIAHWGAIGNTSVAGLREAFLRRPGQLGFRADAWRLKVEKKTLDILMERLPWGFSLIRHAWMAQPLMVEWL